MYTIVSKSCACGEATGAEAPFVISLGINRGIDILFYAPIGFPPLIASAVCIGDD